MAPLRWITGAVLALGAIFTCGTLMWHAQWNTGLVEWVLVGAFIAWNLSPYVVMGVLNFLSKGSSAESWIWFVGAIAAVAYAVYAHVDNRIHPDAQGALVFIFVPLTQWGWATLLFLPWIFITIRRRIRSKPGPDVAESSRVTS